MRLSDYCPMRLMKLQLPILYFCYEHRSRNGSENFYLKIRISMWNLWKVVDSNSAPGWDLGAKGSDFDQVPGGGYWRGHQCDWFSWSAQKYTSNECRPLEEWGFEYAKWQNQVSFRRLGACCDLKFNSTKKWVHLPRPAICELLV